MLDETTCVCEEFFQLASLGEIKAFLAGHGAWDHPLTGQAQPIKYDTTTLRHHSIVALQ
jgi:hypothetical protein